MRRQRKGYSAQITTPRGYGLRMEADNPFEVLLMLGGAVLVVGLAINALGPAAKPLQLLA